MNYAIAIVAVVMLTGFVRADLVSGLQPGEIVPAYNPDYVAGPDKGTAACPV